MSQLPQLPPDSELSVFLRRGAVPEHSVFFMQAASGGQAFAEGGFLFLYADSWLMGIGYPLAAPTAEGGEGGASEHGTVEACTTGCTSGSTADSLADSSTGSKSDSTAGSTACNTANGTLGGAVFSGEENAATPDAAEAFAAAFARAQEKTGARSCYAIAPHLPERFAPHLSESDTYYVLAANAPVPKALRRPVAKAAERLRVEESTQFTPAHRRLWAEFLGKGGMRPNVRELYARTEALLAAARAGGKACDVRLLNAWDAEGNLAASLLMDYSPSEFCAYIIGTHSKRHYAPHATDLLFAYMLEQAKKEGKRYIHLGLGVNDGIRRFKEKWGAGKALPYHFAAWAESGGRISSAAPEENAVNALMQSFMDAPGMSKQELFESFPQQRTFAMIYEVRKGDALSYLCGSAHFFRYSFDFSFRKLFTPLHTVIFEGPLDEDFLALVEQSGKNPGPEAHERLLAAMTEDEVRRLERVVYGPEGRVARLFGYAAPRRVDVRALLGEARPWYAFFSLWVAYLERLGWRQSVDLEAWRVAKDMGKAVVAMENLEEQLASLESVPVPRVVEYFRHCNEWRRFAERNVRTYLAGDLSGMMGSSVEFPTRTEQVIDKRDQRFRVRMRPFLEIGGCAVFVGSAHLFGLVPMLRSDGFEVRKIHLGQWARMRNMFGKKG